MSPAGHCHQYWMLSEILRKRTAESIAAGHDFRKDPLVEDTARAMREHAAACERCGEWAKGFKMAEASTYCKTGWNLYDVWAELGDDESGDEELAGAWAAFRDHCQTCEQCKKFAGNQNEPEVGEKTE